MSSIPFWYVGQGEQLRRLQTLRDQVWTTGPEHLNLNSYFDTKGKCYDVTEINAGFLAKITKCGTTACFAGHAALAMFTLGQNPHSTWTGTLEYLRNYFGIDGYDMFGSSHHCWPVPLFDRVEAYRRDGDESNTAQWRVLVEHLDERIKELGS